MMTDEREATRLRREATTAGQEHDLRVGYSTRPSTRTCRCSLCGWSQEVDGTGHAAQQAVSQHLLVCPVRDANHRALFGT